MDLVRFELTTSSMPWKRAPNCATGPLKDSFYHTTLRVRAGTLTARVAPLPTMKHALSGAFAALVLMLCLLVAWALFLPRAAPRDHAAGGKSLQPLLIADSDRLSAVLARNYNAVHDFTATVDMVPALGSTEKSHITEYKDVRAYILFRKPADIRIIGLFPVVRTKAFDMVSDGDDFKLYIPSKNRFIVGRNEVEKPSTNKLENLRPQHFLEALLVHPVDPADKLILENFTDEDNAYYILHEVSESHRGATAPAPHHLVQPPRPELARQIIFDDAGNILTDARYVQWHRYDNVPFPKHIEINRPRDEYAVVIDVVKMDINKGVSDDKFVLEQPKDPRSRGWEHRRRQPARGTAARGTPAVTGRLVVENLKNKPMRSLLSILLIGVPVTSDPGAGRPERRHVAGCPEPRARHRRRCRGARFRRVFGDQLQWVHHSRRGS